VSSEQIGKKTVAAGFSLRQKTCITGVGQNRPASLVRTGWKACATDFKEPLNQKTKN
jgi:hypothetical protein